MKKNILPGNLLLYSLVLSVSLLGTACGSYGSSRSNDAAMGEVFKSDTSYMDSSYITEETGAAPEYAGNAEQAGGSLVQIDRKLIKEVELFLETKEFDPLISNIKSQVSKNGGYIESSDMEGNDSYGSSKYANIVARIPADKLDTFLSQVETGGNLVRKTENLSDVTFQYSDIESHKTALKAEQERLLALLDKAENVDSIILIENKLTDIRYQLESYESQLKLYDNQISYSTVSIQVNEVIDYTPVEDTLAQRFKDGFSTGVENMIDTGIGLMIFLISMSPVFLLVLFIAFIIYLMSRAVKKIGKPKAGKKKVVSGNPAPSSALNAEANTASSNSSSDLSETPAADNTPESKE